MKVIYGGSFNPPTKAHLEISKKVISKYNVIEFVICPTSLNYQKKDLISNQDRLNMLMILKSKLKNTTITDFEMKQEKYKGTYFTLNHFKDHYFLLGSDNLINIKSWINFPKVVTEFKYIVLKRDGIDIEKFINDNLYEYKNNFLIFDEFEEINNSSTLFRKTFNKDLLIDEIYEYIKEHNLYGVSN